MSDPPQDPPFEVDERIQEAMARVLWLGATAVNVQPKKDHYETAARWPRVQYRVDHFTKDYPRDQFSSAQAAEQFATDVEAKVASGEIIIDHDWGYIITYRLSEVDMRRMAVAKKRGRATNTPVVLGTSKVADTAGPACLRCGATPETAGERCRGARRP